jgi:hypothetical protein
MQAHEYSVVGHSRANVGRYIGAFAALVASGATAWGAGLASVSARLGFPQWTQTVLLIPVTGGLVYLLSHWLFNRYAWRSLCWVSQVPHIAGTWDCDGVTIGDNGEIRFAWKAVMTISQDWEKIRVHLRTAQSASNSVSAALLPEPDGCWQLMYSYRNEPRVGEPTLNPHIGYCEMRFDKNISRGEGDYFNARARGTSGRMTLTRNA